MTRLTALAALALLATGCDGKWARGGWPKPITRQGDQVMGLWQGSLIAAGLVGLFVIVLIVGSALLFRRRGDELPRQVRYNLPIEVLYTVIPVIMIAVLFYFTALRENDEDKFSAHPDVRIGVEGFQWSWQFVYPDSQLVVTGRPGQPPTLVLPVDSNVRFYERSQDVVHSFWVIPFLFKRDVIPGHPNSFEVRLTHTGTFKGKCTEYCGTDHDRMLFVLRVVDRSQYQSWLSEKQQTAQAGTNTMFTPYPDSSNFLSEFAGDNGGESQRSNQ